MSTMNQLLHWNLSFQIWTINTGDKAQISIAISDLVLIIFYFSDYSGIVHVNMQTNDHVDLTRK